MAYASKNLSLEEKAAQLLMIDLPDCQELSPRSAAHLGNYAWNGVVLFAKNVSDLAGTQNLVNQLQEAARYPLYMAIDQEGGLVDRFRFPQFSLSPGARALGALDDPQAVYTAHLIMGRELAQMGIHIDFAPCLDVNNNLANPIIGVRALAEEADKVARLGVEAICGLRQGGVIPTAKHFPGHGNTSLDSHLELPIVSGSRRELEETELLPFRAAIEAQVEAIMTAHILFPAFDPQLPATLSPTILKGLLRQEMGYEGVIVTDSIAMKSIANRWGYAQASVMALEAGADLILAMGSFEEQLEALEGIVQAVRSGRLSEERLDSSLQRLERWRPYLERRPQEPWTPDPSHRQRMEEIIARTPVVWRNRAGLWPLHLEEGAKVAVVSPDLLPQSPLGEVSLALELAPLLGELGVKAQEFKFNLASFGPPLNQLKRDLEGFDYILLALYARGELSDSQRELARDLPQICPKTIVLPLSSPYFLEEEGLEAIDTALTAFNYSTSSLRALFRKLLGR